MALLEGRLHGYEGFDLSELQLPVRTLARWGVRRLLLTSSCGAVAAGRRAGDVVVAVEMLDFQMAALVRLGSIDALRLPATAEALAAPGGRSGRGAAWLSTGVHVVGAGAQLRDRRRTGVPARPRAAAP